MRGWQHLVSLVCLAFIGCGDNTKPLSSIEVTVSGLAGSGLVLQNRGGDDLAIDRNGRFAFAAPVAYGASYSIAVAAQPQAPTQTCVIENGEGKYMSGELVAVAVRCTTGEFAVGGVVQGLTGTGLVLQNNGGDDLQVTGDGTFVFASAVASQAAFEVTVKAQPSGPAQTCTVSNGSGTIVAAAVTTVAVECSVDHFVVGGTIEGLDGSVVLQNKLGDNLVVSANGAFTFVTPVASGEAYSVSVLTHPTSPTQTCVVTDGAGTIANADVTSVSVTCTTNEYSIGGTVTGLEGTGLVLRNNDSDDLAVASDGTFTFTTPIRSGETFDVTVATQPSNVSQTCSVSGGSGTVVGSNVTSVTIDCSVNHYTIGGLVSGLDGTGLELALDGGTPLAVGADGTYAFPTTRASGASYTVTVASQPEHNWQTCTVDDATGTVVDSDIANVDITCTTNWYTIGGTVSGVAGTGVTVQNNGGDDLQLAADGSFTFTVPVASGEPYVVAIAAQPTDPWQTCTVTNGAGVVGGGAITNVVITCVNNTYSVGGTISGLDGSVVLQNNLGANLTLTANGSFTFGPELDSGSTYSVTVLTQPGSPSQTCTVSAGAGTITNADVTTVRIACVTNEFAIGGTVTGLAGSGLVLRNNGGDDLSLTGDGTFEFVTKVASGQPYAVTLFAQPSDPTQTCVVTGEAGTVGAADVTTVVVNCATNTYTVGGTLVGLGGATGLVLQNNAGDDQAVSADGMFAFPTPVASGEAYSVTVKTQPTSPWLTCDVVDGDGTIVNANITDVAVSCTPNEYEVSVSVTGLAGGGLVLQNNSGDDLSVAANGTHAFTTQIASGSSYNVTVATQPTSPWQTCKIAAPTGTMGDGVTVAVDCVTNKYSVGGVTTGLTGAGLVLQNNTGDDLPIANDGTFTFALSIASGQPYDVTIKTQPTGQTCAITGGSGTVAGTNVTSVGVLCILTFTSCGATGRLGPTSAQCTTAYAGTPLAGQVTIAGSGIQRWTVPATGNYRIDAFGAQGASGAGLAGGRGARIRGDFALTAGTVLQIVVGQQGRGQGSGSNGGGGGGSFVVTTGGTILVIAGGGGGTRAAATVNGFDASTGTSGVDGNVSTDGVSGAVVPGGSNGSGGAFASSWGSGGGGYSGNGANDSYGGAGGVSFLGGALGGGGNPTCGSGTAADGGFGGGGSGVGCYGGGGGGGYSGGGGGLIAGGGGSYNSGANQLATTGAQTGAGRVTISLIP